MHKLTYINSHKRNKRFVFEIFGLLYSFLSIGVLIYYLCNNGFISKLSTDLFTKDFDILLKPFYFSLIFMGLLLIIFNFGFIRIFKTRISYILYPAHLLSNILLFLSGFLYGQEITRFLYNSHLIAYSIYFIVLMLCFIFEKRELSRYGSFFMRIFDIVCGSLFILYAIQIVTNLFEKYISQYAGFIQLSLVFVSAVYILFNAIYILLKYESRFNIK